MMRERGCIVVDDVVVAVAVVAMHVRKWPVTGVGMSVLGLRSFSLMWMDD